MSTTRIRPSVQVDSTRHAEPQQLEDLLARGTCQFFEQLFFLVNVTQAFETVSRGEKLAAQGALSPYSDIIVGFLQKILSETDKLTNIVLHEIEQKYFNQEVLVRILDNAWADARGVSSSVQDAFGMILAAHRTKPPLLSTSRQLTFGIPSQDLHGVSQESNTDRSRQSLSDYSLQLKLRQSLVVERLQGHIQDKENARASENVPRINMPTRSKDSAWIKESLADHQTQRELDSSRLGHESTPGISYLTESATDASNDSRVLRRSQFELSANKQRPGPAHGSYPVHVSPAKPKLRDRIDVEEFPGPSGCRRLDSPRPRATHRCVFDRSSLSIWSTGEVYCFGIRQ